MKKVTTFGTGLVALIGAFVLSTAARTAAQAGAEPVEQSGQYIPIMRLDGLGPQLVCGTRDVDPETARLVEEYSERLDFLVPAQLTASHTIPVYWHRIHQSSGAGGVVSNQQIVDQLDVLNDAYAAAGFSFSLISVTNTNNDSWYTTSRRRERGGDEDRAPPGRLEPLNIYSEQHGRRPARVGDVPVELRSAPKNGRRGHALRARARRQRGAVQPGRHRDPRGRPLDGPLSHVPGRLHEDQGDGVDDTPAEARPAFGCPTGRDTCAQAIPGSTRSTTSWTTPTTACMDDFTAGQGARMNNTWAAYR